MLTTGQYDLVNLGSTFALHGFGNYHYFPVNGLNLASAPQPLAEDLRKLQKNIGVIEKGAIVFIVVICPFGFCVDEYPVTTARQLSGPLLAKKIRRLKHKLMSDAQRRIEGWMNEFSLDNVTTDKPSEELMRIFKITTDTLCRIISLCTDNGFKPVIINMPAASVESSAFSDGFISDFYTGNLKRVDPQITPILDYFKDERFADTSLYSNGADCLNEKGKKLFAEVLSADLRKLGLLSAEEQKPKANTLSNGVMIPELCFGTNITTPVITNRNGKAELVKGIIANVSVFVKGDREGAWGKIPTKAATKSLSNNVRVAMENGIHCFDTSRAYIGSEARLSLGLKGLCRGNYFIITKIDNQAQFSGRIEAAFNRSLKELNMDYVDCLLLHWPVDYPIVDDVRFKGCVPVFARSWRELEEIYKSGKARAIGVANFSVKQLETLKKYTDIIPMINEFECHPLAIRKELNAYCRENGIQVLAYGSLCAMDKRLQVGALPVIAQKHGRTIAQIVLKWHMQRGRIPIFGTSKKSRIIEYAKLDFVLSDDELSTIDQYNINYRAFPDSEHVDFTKNLWDGYKTYKDNCP